MTVLSKFAKSDNENVDEIISNVLPTLINSFLTEIQDEMAERVKERISVIDEERGRQIFLSRLFVLKRVCFDRF